jgi:N-dimethylarginine dimethylaminohydrolase
MSANGATADGAGPLRARRLEGGTPVLESWGVNSEYGVLRDVLLGPPETFHWMEDNAAYSSIVRDTLRKGYTFDKQLAVRQHREIVDAYERAGVTCHFLPHDELTGYQVYARDSSFMTPYGAVICQLANPRRRGEYAACLRFYLEAGIPIYDMVSAGNFEGGEFDIIEPGCVLLGYTGFRCEEVSARQVGGWFETEGWEVKYAPIDSFYVHIDLMVCMLAEKCAAVCLDTTEDDVVDWLRAKKIEIIPVSFKDTMALGCNVMSLGKDRILSPASSTDLNGKLRAMGFEVYDPEMTMFLKAGGGVHCMSQPLRRDPA